ncbi:MAG: GMC family oxidoreductase N-terminal domain-containing protein [Rhizobiaceae bacterium]|nr:GMC family oxidoreductase N-terminal domain-containing protein [Rhizobiaceae bacterium]
MQSDFVVVGAGSAGCVVAARLAEAGYSVSLLEAGGSDTYPLIHIPAGVGHLLYNPAYNWMYASEPEEGTYGRPIHTPRGKVLGGSSSINGMLYVRGNPADYDGWAQLGCRGWSYDEVLPLFRRAETYAGDGDPNYRGKSGPLKVEDYRTVLPLTHLFVKAAQEAGFQYTPDLNGARQEGVGYAQMTRRGRLRGSTYRTYLQTPAARRNVQVIPDATVSELLFEQNSCVGVRYVQAGETREVRARREVVLSAGPIGSAQLLQLAGIGDGQHLGGLGIATRVPLAGVGRNLSDHLTVRLVCRLRDLTTINQLARGWRLAREVLKFGLLGRGALTFGVTSAMVFCRSREGLESPDLQLLFTPASYVFGKALVLEKDAGMTVAVCPTRPGSRGTVLIDSADPRARPKIRYGFLTDRDDLRVMSVGLAHARRIFGSPALAPYVVDETRPGPGVHSDAEVEEFARREGSSLFHPVGTCKMGIDDMAVVDPRLKVRGIERLRVADSSIMPFLTTGNTNAPTIMIGEKAADMLVEDARGAA